MKQFLEVLHNQSHNTLNHKQRNSEINSVVYDFKPVSTHHTKKCPDGRDLVIQGVKENQSLKEKTGGKEEGGQAIGVSLSRPL